MTCDQAQGELFAFHFALLTLEERTGVEAHLLDCRSCLQAYLAIKLETETARSEPPATAGSPLARCARASDRRAPTAFG